MECNCCNKESVGGVFVEDYFGEDINNSETINKLKEYLFDPNSFVIKGEIRYRGYDLDTAIRYRNGELDPTKEIMKMVTVDKNIFSKIQEIWNKEQKNETN